MTSMMAGMSIMACMSWVDDGQERDDTGAAVVAKGTVIIFEATRF